MKKFKIKLDTDKVNIHLFGDEHIGDKNCDLDYLKKRVQDCKDDPNGVAILLGDICNIALKDSVSFDSYGDTISPMTQLNNAIDIFRPIADKILLLVDGNHEERITKTTSLEAGQLIANELCCNYARSSAVIFIRFGEEKIHHRPMCYSIYCRHGNGGGSKVGGKMNKLESNAAIIDSDVYIQGHTHTPAVFQEDFYRTSFQNSSVNKITHTFVNIGSSLNYGGYGEKFGFVPGTKRHPIITLNNREKSVNVTM